MAEAEKGGGGYAYFKRYREIIVDFPAFMETIRTPQPRYIRVNTLRTDTDTLASRLERRGFRVERTPISEGLEVFGGEPGTTLEYAAGLYYGQDLASMAVAPVLSPEPETRVFDMCAAPGGKTTHIAQIMQNTGRVVANDSDWRRLKPLVEHTGRLGIKSVAVTSLDGARHWYIKRADYILIDPPCSSEGTVRKNPEVLRKLSAQFTKTMAGTQKRLLLAAIKNARKGVVIVYSTCTFAPEENEAVISAALGTGLVEVEPVETPLGHSRGLKKWVDENGEEHLFGGEMEKTIRIYPHQNDSGGMYIARLRRI